MKTKVILLIRVILLFIFTTSFSQSTNEASTLSVGLDNIAFAKGSLDVELIAKIIEEKQKELVAEGVKRFLLKKIIKTDDFYTQFYLERITNILFEEKNHQVMTKKILEETTNYLFILGTTEFVLNSKKKGFEKYKLFNINADSLDKIKLSDIDKHKRERLIYLIYYICKDIKIIKNLGFLNNFNYSELESPSNHKKFEEIRIGVDFLKSFNGNNTDEILEKLTLTNIPKAIALLKLFDVIDEEDAKEFNNIFEKIKKSDKKFKKIIKEINELEIKDSISLKDDYNRIKNILNLLNVKILEKYEDMNKDTIKEKIKEFKQKATKYKSITDLFESYNLDIIKEVNNTIDAIKNVEDYDAFKKFIPTNLDILKTKEDSIFKNALNEYEKNETEINNFKIRIKEKIKPFVASLNFKTLKSNLKNVGIQLFENKKEKKFLEFLMLIRKKIYTIKSIKNIDINKQNIVEQITTFIENLLENQGVLKDVFKLTNLKKGENNEKIHDVLIKKYDDILSDYNGENLVYSDSDSEETNLTKHINYINKQITTILNQKKTIKLFSKFKKFKNGFLKIINKQELKKGEITKSSLLGKYKDSLKTVITNISAIETSSFKKNLKTKYGKTDGELYKLDKIYLSNLNQNLGKLDAKMSTYQKSFSSVNKQLYINTNKLRTIYKLYNGLSEIDKNITLFNNREDAINNNNLNELITKITNLIASNSSNDSIKITDKIKKITSNNNMTEIKGFEEFKKPSYTKSELEARITMLNSLKNSTTNITTNEECNECENVLKSIFIKDNKAEPFAKPNVTTDLTINGNTVTINRTFKISKLREEIVDTISSLKGEVQKQLDMISYNQEISTIYTDVITNYKKLKNDVTIKILGGDVQSLFTKIQTSVKGITFNKNEHNKLNETEMATLKKFNRIILQRNITDKVNGLELAKALDENLMADLYLLKSKIKDSDNFKKILNTVEFAIAVLIKNQVTNKKEMLSINDIEAFQDFIKFIANIKELNKAETFSYLLKTMSNYKELFNLEDDNSLVDFINSIRTYSIINKKNNVIEIDAASVLSHFTEKYKNHKVEGSGFIRILKSASFYATVGVNQFYIPNLEIEGFDSDTKSFSAASEKIGVQFKLFDFENDNFEKDNLMHKIKKKPFVSNIYAMPYASGILYKIANTTDNGFDKANVGIATGFTFFNSLDFNVSIAMPFTKKPFKNHIIGFSFDIPLSEYLSRL